MAPIIPSINPPNSFGNVPSNPIRRTDLEARHDFGNAKSDSSSKLLGYSQLRKIKHVLGIDISNEALLTTALTHRSYLNEPEGADAESNDRLETLGDAVIQLAITGILYEMDPALNEGQLTLIRSRVVSNETLAQVARRLNLGEYLRMGKGERQSGGASKASNLAGAFEALVGAIFQDNKIPKGVAVYVNKDGYAAFKFCENVLKDEIADAYQAVAATPSKPEPNQRNNKPKHQRKDKPAAKNSLAKKQPAKKQSAKSAAVPNIAGKHPKTALQEIIQAKRGHGSLPEYRVVQSTGKDNAPTFVVEATFNGKTLGKGSGRSKQAAETAAAKQALRAGAF